MDIHANNLVTKASNRCLTCGGAVRRVNPAARMEGRGKYCSRSCAGRSRMTTHGQSKRPGAYRTWHSMKQRCLNPNSQSFANYGGRGVTVCERWIIFANFYADMGDRPEGMSLDRIDSYGNYEPGNCRWATKKQQCNNFRDERQFRLSYKGGNYTLQELADKLGLDRYTLRRRVTTSRWPEDMWHLPPNRTLRPR